MARPGLTGVLLVGGASRRFGSPKALARFESETLAERAWRILGEACGERLAVGKGADRLELPFPLVDDGADLRAPLAGVVAGLRAASNELCVFLPVDMPFVTTDLLLELAAVCVDAAVTQGGPLPGVYRRSTLGIFEAALASDDLSLRSVIRGLEVAILDADPALLANVNEPADLKTR